MISSFTINITGNIAYKDDTNGEFTRFYDGSVSGNDVNSDEEFSNI